MAVITEIEVNKKHTLVIKGRTIIFLRRGWGRGWRISKKKNIPAQQKLLNNARKAMEKN